MKMTPPLLPAILILCSILAPFRSDAPTSDHPRQDPSLAMEVSESLMSVLPIPEIYEEGVGYPGPFKDKAVKWAKVFEVPSSWLIPLGYVESKYQPLAKNPSGATGAAQIKLARARDLVTWMGRSKWKANQEVQEILAQREPIYRGIADLAVDTASRGVEEVATAICRRLPAQAPRAEWIARRKEG